MATVIDGAEAQGIYWHSNGGIPTGPDAHGSIVGLPHDQSDVVLAPLHANPVSKVSPFPLSGDLPLL